jgi:hypothetical protein
MCAYAWGAFCSLSDVTATESANLYPSSGRPRGRLIDFFSRTLARPSANGSCSGVKTYMDVVISPNANGRARSGIILVVNQNNNLKCHDFISIL